MDILYCTTVKVKCDEGPRAHDNCLGHSSNMVTNQELSISAHSAFDCFTPPEFSFRFIQCMDFI